MKNNEKSTAVCMSTVLMIILLDKTSQSFLRRRLFNDPFSLQTPFATVCRIREDAAVCLRPEVVAAVGTVIRPAPRGEPALAAPCVALACDRLEDCDPPVEQDENKQPDDPADHRPDDVVDTEQNKPEAAVPLLFACQHGTGTAAPRAFDIQRHIPCLLSFDILSIADGSIAVKCPIVRKIFAISGK